MKFYITGRMSNIGAVREAVDEVKARGHEISFEWSDPSLPSAKPFHKNPELAATYASQSIQGVVDADVYLMLSAPDGNGVFGEFGAALAMNAASGSKRRPRIYAIGQQEETLFHFHSAIEWRADLKTVLDELEALK